MRKPKVKDFVCCPLEAAMSVIGGKWKPLIIFHLNEKRRFNEIRRRLPQITQRMLTTQLRELEGDGILVRKVYAEVPPRVEYTLTTKGKSLMTVLLELKKWGERQVLPDMKAS